MISCLVALRNTEQDESSSVYEFDNEPLWLIVFNLRYSVTNRLYSSWCLTRSDLLFPHVLQRPLFSFLPQRIETSPVKLILLVFWLSILTTRQNTPLHSP
jgi:hypothetical protein